MNGINYGRHVINDNDFYWLCKLSNKILDENSTITPKMLFDITKINNEEQMSLDILKRKLNSLVFKKQCKADELNFMIKALDVNKNNKLTFEEFNDLLLLPKKFGNIIKGADNYKEINDEENENKIQDEPKEQPKEVQNQQAAE